MATPAELRDRLENLRSIRASAEREVQFGDERVVYRSDEEIAAASGARPLRMVRFSTSKGI